ncbi:MAG: alpha/beta hydrolase [bacterium]|nr:alpha/beta hydrolase [bacterium]
MFRIVVFVSLLFAFQGCSQQPDPAVHEAKSSASDTSPDPDAHYLFYLHGKIVEDQGSNAVSERFGPYEYNAILEALREHGFEVISEVRPAGTEPTAYAHKVVSQIHDLTEAGVPSRQITVVGASKGAGIAVLISHEVNDPDLSYVLLAICSGDLVARLDDNGICISGRVLSIFDHADSIAGSCDLLRDQCVKRLTAFNEIKLQVGAGHGVLYRPLAEWTEPTARWAHWADHPGQDD